MQPVTSAAPAATAQRDLAFAAVRFGWLCAAPVALLVYASGLVPAEHRTFVVLGAAAALLSPVLLLPLQRRAMSRSTSAADSLLFQATLQAGMLVKLLVVGGGTLALTLASVKFGSIAVFALVFLGVAMIGQVASACHMARSLAQRARSGESSSLPVSDRGSVAAPVATGASSSS